MRVVLLSAFRGDGEGYGGSGWRDRSYTALYDIWQTYPWEVFQADSGDQPFSVSRSYNQAAQDAGDWDKAVIHPPDSWAPFEQIAEAVSRVKGLVYAYNHQAKLTEEQTEAFYAGDRSVKGEKKNGHSAPFVISRWLWDEIGGFDDRLSGWGAEDSILNHCCRVLGTVSRVSGPMYFMYHPKDFAPNDVNRQLYDEVRGIIDPDALRRYLEER